MTITNGLASPCAVLTEVSDVEIQSIPKGAPERATWPTLQGVSPTSSFSDTRMNRLTPPQWGSDRALRVSGSAMLLPHRPHVVARGREGGDKYGETQFWSVAQVNTVKTVEYCM
jgi:hypothetical protein